ncbi:MAG: DNA mismatch repair protein MutS [Deltaproteobacteria bacterium]|nr:DNA mismatch repair protein MutS [Candidatus Anaeroferrophillacea bacterium]
MSPGNPTNRTGSDTYGGKLTPMLRQYLGIKRRHPDTILFYRMGDFYEMFFDDAVEAARILKITLTSRNKKEDEPIPMCGVPYHAAADYLAKLIAAGRKVAVCDQVEDPQTAKGLVKREVTKIVTPGVTLEQDTVAADRYNYLVCVTRRKDTFGIAGLEATTGDFRVTETAAIELLLAELTRLAPRELLLSERDVDAEWKQRIVAVLPGLHLTVKSESALFSPGPAAARLCTHFGTLNLDGYGCRDLPAATAAAGAALGYVQETQAGRPLDHIARLTTYRLDSFMQLDAGTIQNLELLTTMQQGGKRGSLFGVLDRCRTAMGSRRLKSQLLYPLLDRGAIDRRLDAVAALVAGRGTREALRRLLDGVHDLERLASRLAGRSANARDLLSLADTLTLIPRVIGEIGKLEELPPLLAELAAGLDAIEILTCRLTATLAEEPPLALTEGGLIAGGVDTHLDELRRARAEGHNWILTMEREEKERTGINGLKIRFNRVFGYYIEITHRNRELVPDDYLRKQTLSNADRYITPRLKELEEKILGAQEKIQTLEYELFTELREAATGFLEAIQENARRLARLDVLLSHADLADEQRYCRPTMTDRRRLFIGDGRHPVVEALQPDERFIPNDCRLDGENEQMWIVTGPNMAGKSTFLRQVGLIALLAQIGSFVPASEAELPVFDRIFTRVGASDNLSRGLSTFMVEMTETAHILNHASDNSLIILDEIGRGTSTFDGVSIAWAVAEHIHDVIGSLTLFATHYHELTELSAIRQRIRNYNVAVKQLEDTVVFLRQVLPGATNRSYGIEVARMAGLPPGVLTRAREILGNLEQAECSADCAPRPAGRSGGKNPGRDGGNTAAVGDHNGTVILSPASPDSGSNNEVQRPETGGVGVTAGPPTATGFLPSFAPPPEPDSSAADTLDQVRRVLAKMDIDRTTPLKALVTLDKLKQLL